MPTVTRRLEIDAGHRLVGHESKCAHLHGHRYAFEIMCSAPKLDDIGRVVDFSVIKAKVGTWLDEHWDHAFLFREDDPLLPKIIEAGEHRIFVLDVNPTAENLAAFLLAAAQILMFSDLIRVESVICYETPNCYAIAYPDDAEHFLQQFEVQGIPDRFN